MFDETPVVDSYKDLTPRAAVTYDLFGNGKTALKATLGKYLESTVTASNYGLGNPTSRHRHQRHQDLDRPQRQLESRTATSRTRSTQDFGPTGDFCGVISNLNFGTATFSNTIDPDILQGLGRAAVGLELGRVGAARGAAAHVGRGRLLPSRVLRLRGDRQPGGDARPTSRQFSITAPQDPRLPNGGGYQVGTLYDLNNPALFGVTRNYITYADRYGEAYQKFNGIDVSVSARPGNGLTVQGGFSGGYSTSDNCEVRDKVPEIALLNPYCHIETSFLPQYKGIATYIVPKIDVAISGTFTSKPGIQVSGFGTPVAGGAFAANYTVSNAVVAPILGRPLAGSAPNITVNLIEPHSILGERVNELNMRVGKIFRFGGSRANVGVDFYNLLNAATPLSYNQAFIPERRVADADVGPVGPVREAQPAAGLLMREGAYS